ncbi:MAG: acetylglutamate kinase [Fibrobacteraceae bacterium]|nr:acetylglutamate kinase [Fibrobacteraceae bacterium]
MKTVVVKIGGSLAIDEAKLLDFIHSIAKLPALGYKVALVHGGGKDINENIALLSEEPQFIEGLRVTTPNIMKMVEMTLSGYVNKKLVRMLENEGCPAVGISGIDGKLFEAKKRESGADLGCVGNICNVNPKLVTDLWNAGWAPVVSPISIGSGVAWNVNADTAASELAVALKAEKFLLVSDVPGVLDKQKNVISNLDEQKVESLIADETICGGMIPKVRESVKALRRGLKQIHILGWKNSEHFVKQINGEINYGTILE